MRRPKSREIQRVALYLQVSSREQVQGYSPETQESDLRGWAASKGWEVTGVYKDLGATGTSVKDRYDFKRMMADAVTERWDAVLVDKNDRFARSRRD